MQKRVIRGGNRTRAYKMQFFKIILAYPLKSPIHPISYVQNRLIFFIRVAQLMSFPTTPKSPNLTVKRGKIFNLIKPHFFINLTHHLPSHFYNGFRSQIWQTTTDSYSSRRELHETVVGCYNTCIKFVASPCKTKSKNFWTTRYQFIGPTCIYRPPECVFWIFQVGFTLHTFLSRQISTNRNFFPLTTWKRPI